jgi:acetyl esterase/lipase
MLVLSAFLATAQTGINSTTAAVATPTPASSKPKPSSTPLLLPTPTAANVPYGPTEKQILDFYQAKSKNPGEPTPVLFFTHGGSWLGRDKRGDSWLTEQNRIQKFFWMKESPS